jgi:hypothetical protein
MDIRKSASQIEKKKTEQSFRRTVLPAKAQARMVLGFLSQNPWQGS